MHILPFLFLLRMSKRKKEKKRTKETHIVFEMEHMEKRTTIQRDEDLDGFSVSSAFRG